MQEQASAVSTEAMHTLRRFTPKQRRRILCVSPKFSRSFGTFNHTFPIMNVKGFMPPQGLLLVAGLIPEGWDVRFVDENVAAAEPADFEWADVVFTSGMHIQRERIRDIIRRAHAAGKPVALGGPSVSSAPYYYPEADFLHIGEAGDGTLRMFEHVDESARRPEGQLKFHNPDRLPMEQFPTPAYHLVQVADYLLGSIQFSSGCPFTCEFCDIPALYGRNPRLKRPEQIVRELDQLADCGAVSVYFVDDNFIGNPKAAAELLPHLIEWQRRRDFQVRLSCEATLNIARYSEVLEQMRQAFFTNIFIGIETPEPAALKAIKKTQNLRSPILEAVQTINRYGLEVASGIIMGLETDTPATPQAIVDFARQSNIPIMTVNILYALPHTALYERYEKEGRILSEAESAHRDSNIRFRIPYDQIVANWRNVIHNVFAPEALYARYDYNARQTYPHRLGPTRPWKQLTAGNLKRALSIFTRLVWRIGLRSDYRRTFWKMAWTQLSQGKVETMFQVAMVAHHLITYGRECVHGQLQASNYSARTVVEDSLHPPHGDKPPASTPSEAIPA
jgi:radical SAM superfamily enzyme YgiQ (UPF0313 family)